MLRSLSTVGLTSSTFESILAKCYSIKYKDEYTKLTSSLKESVGIVGFTKRGIAHTCYYPDYYETYDESYSNHSNHLSKCVEKFMDNPDYFVKQDLSEIYEWHFDVYEYQDARITSLLRDITRNAIRVKAANPSRYPHVSREIKFNLLVHDYFYSEIQYLKTANLLTEIVIQSEHKYIVGDHLKAKVEIVFNSNDEDIDELMSVLNKYYVIGIKVVEELKNDNDNDNDDVYNKLMKFIDKYNNDVFGKICGDLSHMVYQQKIEKFISDFDERFKSYFNKHKMKVLKQYFISSWIKQA
jgi:hypothetical protein